MAVGDCCVSSLLGAATAALIMLAADKEDRAERPHTTDSGKNNEYTA